MDQVPFLWTDPNSQPGQIPDQLIVIFKEVAQKNNTASVEAGYDVFDNVLVAEVSAGGQMAKSTVVCEIERKLPDGKVKKNEYYSRRYASVLEQYKNGKTDIGVGTPLHFLPNMDAGRIATLKGQGIHFIETLAIVADSSAASEMMGFRDMRSAAQKFLDLREKNAPMVKMEETAKELRAENETLKRQMQELIDRFGGTEPPKRGPGRPPKVREEEAA